METSYLFHPDGTWMEVIVSGPVTKEGMLAAYRGFLADPQFQPGMHLLCDLRHAELKTHLDAVQLLAKCVADSRERRGENYRVATVVRYGFQESLSKIYALLTRGQPCEFRVFKDRTNAVEWLLEKATAPAG